MLTLLNAAVLPMSNSAPGGGTTGLAILTFILGIAYLAFVIGALVSIIGSNRYTTGTKALWVLAVIIAPFIGSIIWFIWGRRG